MSEYIFSLVKINGQIQFASKLLKIEFGTTYFGVKITKIHRSQKRASLFYSEIEKNGSQTSISLKTSKRPNEIHAGFLIIEINTVSWYCTIIYGKWLSGGVG